MNYVQAKHFGRRYYDSPKPCNRGHKGLRRVSDRHCIECDRERHAREYQKRRKEVVDTQN